MIPTDEPEIQEQEEVQEEPEQILEPSPEPSLSEEIIPVQEQVNNVIEELITDEVITDEQLENIAELLLENYEIDEPMPMAELLEELNEEQILELLK